MTDLHDLHGLLAGASVEAEVFALRPDYRVLLIAVDGIAPGPSDASTEQLLIAAEDSVAALGEQPIQDLPHVASWREAYRSFGAKPQRTRNSLEALLRRASSGLPRVNRLTDIYNAVSVQRLIPLGGENLAAYAGPPRLVRATGDEDFDTMADGGAVVEYPEPGEVVWRDDAGVTCRRWNWRQCSRTQLADDTTSALLILDALDPVTDEELRRTGDELIAHFATLGGDLRVAQRVLSAD